MVRMPDRHVIGPCGTCDCPAFNYDGPPQESKLISIRDMWDRNEEARMVIDRLSVAPYFEVKMHDHVLTDPEIVEAVKKAKDQKVVVLGEDTEVELVYPHGMFGSENAKADLMEAGLRLIAEAASDDPQEWSGKYGTKFNNETFAMRPYHPDRDDEPNFRFFSLAFDVTWYKFIGRDMEFSRELPSSGYAKIISDCLESLHTR